MPNPTAPCRIAQCDGSMHVDGMCSREFSTHPSSYVSLTSYPGEQPRLDVHTWLDGQAATTAEALEVAAELRSVADAIERGAALLAASQLEGKAS